MNRGSPAPGSPSFVSSHSFTAITSLGFFSYSSPINPSKTLRRIWRSSWSKVHSPLCPHVTCSGLGRRRMSGMPDTHFGRYAHHERMSRGKHALLIQLGERIERLRKKKGYTQTDLAVHLDMNRGHLSDIERGKREVRIITLQVIARGLDTTMSSLLRGL